MSAIKSQWGLIILGIVLYWGYQFTHIEAATFSPNTNYRVCFSPMGGCERRIVQQIDQAKHSIFVQSYSFTSKPIANALIHAHNRGVKVKIISDRGQFDPKAYTQIRRLEKSGIPIWVDDHVNIQHNKVMILDRSTVETGSYNFTKSANKYNAENILLINDPKLAAKYMANWEHRQQASIPATDYIFKPRRRYRRGKR